MLIAKNDLFLDTKIISPQLCRTMFDFSIKSSNLQSTQARIKSQKGYDSDRL